MSWIIATVAGFLASLEAKSVRLQAANRLPEHTWLNHALITVIFGGGIGAAIGFVCGIPTLGFKIGLAVALALYAYREVRQWWNASKPSGFWWDACLDVAFPAWLVSYPLGGPIPFGVMTLVVACFHWFLRPVE